MSQGDVKNEKSRVWVKPIAALGGVCAKRIAALALQKKPVIATGFSYMD